MILQPRYNARRYSAYSVITLIGCWIPLKNGVILQSSNTLLTIRVLCRERTIIGSVSYRNRY